ncbi:uncharacterized protein LOC134336569 isoform X2 [Mobula hypostoma]|uniref:uncharacterized protein LOC134336569 isoform X2 n=1 Tax=Mobula hypostoma TaxID=723540 RepID=UPI002FC330D4
MEDTSESVAGLNFQQPRRGKGSPGTNSRHHDIEPGDHVVVRTFKRKNCWNLDLKDPFREFWSLIQPSRFQEASTYSDGPYAKKLSGREQADVRLHFAH